jgi:hypothetical protein
MLLVDLESDPDETRDVSTVHLGVVKKYHARTMALAKTLAAPTAAPGSLQPEDLEKLRGLGYVD